MPGMRGGPGGGPMNGGSHGKALPNDGSAPAAPAIADVVERVVGRFDGDADDVITLAEVLAVLDPDGTRTTLAEKAGAAVAAADGDGNGGLSVAELTAAVTALDTDGDGTLDRDDRSGTTPPADPPAIALLLHGHGPRGGDRDVSHSVADIVERVVVRLDGDDSGTISLSELVAHLGRHGQADADARATALLSVLDTDHDQEAGAAELSAVLTAADADADGLVEWAEFVALPDDFAQLMGQPHGHHGG